MDAARIDLPVRLRNGPEHDAALARTGNPYVLEVAVEGGGALLYHGARHSSDRSDPQTSAITERWKAFEAVVGSGHVIRQEWVLCALLGMDPAWDQPVPGGE